MNEVRFGSIVSMEVRMEVLSVLAECLDGDSGDQVSDGGES